jgi:hypothetical protein
VLQEVAAARIVLIMCGTTELDGYLCLLLRRGFLNRIVRISHGLAEIDPLCDLADKGSDLQARLCVRQCAL